MVEFALIAPLLFLAVFTIIESALFLNAQITLDNAVREGARVAALCGSSKAASVEYHGVTYTGQPTACSAAVIGEVQRNTGFLTVLNPNVNPAIGVCSPPPVSGRCSAAYSGAARGSQIQVDGVYRYTYYLYPFLGQSSPSATLSSVAKVVSQQ